MDEGLAMSQLPFKLKAPDDWLWASLWSILIVAGGLLLVLPKVQQPYQQRIDRDYYSLANHLNVSISVLSEKNLKEREVHRKAFWEEFSKIREAEEALEVSNKEKRIASTIKPEVEMTLVTKRILRAPGKDYEEAYFYLNNKKIATQRIRNNHILEQFGDIPDSKIEFVNDQYKSYGEEFYKDGKLHGRSVTYYEKGAVEKEIFYIYGELMLVKQYFKEGQLKTEINYEDARDYPGETEVGVGKIYYEDGSLRYEWNITNSLPQGYKKAYNDKQELTHEVYINQKGEQI